MVVEAFSAHFSCCFCGGMQVGSKGKANGDSHSCRYMAVDGWLVKFNVEGKGVGRRRGFGGGAPVEVFPFSCNLFC